MAGELLKAVRPLTPEADLWLAVLLVAVADAAADVSGARTWLTRSYARQIAALCNIDPAH